MTNKLFLKKENMQLLWDIVSDEDNFKFLTLNIQSKIYNIFYNNIQGFYETNMLKIKSLVELNKIGEALFTIASGNSFYSDMYAKLYKELMELYPFMTTIFKTNFDSTITFKLTCFASFINGVIRILYPVF